MNKDVIYSKMFFVDRLNPLGRVYYTKLTKIIEMLCGPFSMTPGGKPEELGRSIRVGAHLEYGYNLFKNVLR